VILTEYSISLKQTFKYYVVIICLLLCMGVVHRVHKYESEMT